MTNERLSDEMKDDQPGLGCIGIVMPCPFCGCAAHYFTFSHDHGTDHIVDCSECPARIETGKMETTIAAWNQRIVEA